MRIVVHSGMFWYVPDNYRPFRNIDDDEQRDS